MEENTLTSSPAALQTLNGVGVLRIDNPMFNALSALVVKAISNALDVSNRTAPCALWWPAARPNLLSGGDHRL
jgi:hypothetical protein